MAIQVVSKRIVKPAVLTPDHLRTCKLSFFDQLAPPAHVPLVSFYHNDTISQHEIRKYLVKSLSQALTKFYPLAGRFVRDGFYVDCNDEGVLYVEAEVDLELDEFLCIARKNAELVNDLVPWSSIGETSLVTTPIMGIKVTMFKCGGLSIAILLSHVIADGYTAATFVHEWAVTTSDLLHTNIDHGHVFATKPDDYEFGVANHFPSRDLSTEIKPGQVPSSKIKEGKIVTKRFVFDENAILTLKAKVSKSTNISRPTRVEVVTSTIWKSLLNIAANQSKRKQSTLYLHLNLRGRTSMMAPPLPSDNTSLCGNFYMEVPTKINNKTDTRELHDLVNLLRKSLRSSLGKCSKISSPEEMFVEVAKNYNEIEEEKGNEEVDVHLLSTLCRFPVYEVDFGWGKPEWVTTGGMPVELIFLFDTKCETGIEAIVNLNEADMIEFEKDLDIKAYTS